MVVGAGELWGGEGGEWVQLEGVARRVRGVGSGKFGNVRGRGGEGKRGGAVIGWIACCVIYYVYNEGCYSGRACNVGVRELGT